MLRNQSNRKVCPDCGSVNVRKRVHSYNMGIKKYICENCKNEFDVPVEVSSRLTKKEREVFVKELKNKALQSKD